jgi:hypothetical protein
VKDENIEDRATNSSSTQANKKLKPEVENKSKSIEILSKNTTPRRSARIQAKDSQKPNNSSTPQGEGSHANSS